MQIAASNRYPVLSILGASALLAAVTIAWADDVSQPKHHQPGAASQERPCNVAGHDVPAVEGFEGVQVETSDLGLFEQFFEGVLQVPVLQRADHPQADRLRGYCYRGLLIVVRQDLRTTRPAGWVQLNFRVPDVAAVQEEIERLYRGSSISQLAEGERAKIVRFRFKPDVMRGDRRVARFEIGGPEGFMIGFDQEK